jgi:hypothetical protein
MPNETKTRTTRPPKIRPHRAERLPTESTRPWIWLPAGRPAGELATLPELTAAQIEAAENRHQRHMVVRAIANALADEFENVVRATAHKHNIVQEEELIDYVETLIGTRVLERRLAP